jgi:hypothetical protein
MANLTLTQARSRVFRLLDDPNGITGTSRYNPDAAFTDVDQALSFAISGCLSRYAKVGDRFDIETTGTSDATDGTLDVSSAVPLIVKGVAVVVGSNLYRLRARDPIRRGVADLNARSLRVTYVREYVLPTTTSHPLIGAGATAANSWPAFDEWVCCVAAQHLQPLDNDQRGALEATIMRAERDVFERPNVPSGHEWPRTECPDAYDAIRWQWRPSTSEIFLVRSSL